MPKTPSPQSLSGLDRRTVAAWAADCAERTLSLFEQEAPDDPRAREAIARARAFSHGELSAAGEITRRFVAGRAAASASTPAGVAAARSAAQAAGVAHMGAHALGAAAYAVAAVSASRPQDAAAADHEIGAQFELLSTEAASALRRLPLLGSNSAGPLGAGLLASGVLGSTIRDIQSRLLV
ncbi:putative immunity protein [Microbacterium phyllosphaerae]